MARKTASRNSGKAVAVAQRPARQASNSTWPRVDLLPPIVETRRKQNGTLRLLSLALVGIAAIAVLASLGAGLGAMQAEGALADETARGQKLAAEEQNYTDVIAINNQLSAQSTAKTAALFWEVDWPNLLVALDGALPAGVSLDSETVTVKPYSSNGTATTTSGTPVTAIDKPGVIVVAFEATSPDVPSTIPLLNQLQAIPGVVTARVETFAVDTEVGYRVTGEVQIDATWIGTTARSKAIDSDAVKQLRDDLFKATVTPVTPTPSATSTTGADSTTEDLETGTGN